jgi:hypothetical protein
MWLAVVLCASRIGLLDAYFSAITIDLYLLIVLGCIFIAGQLAIWLNLLDIADTIAQFLPKVGLICFGLAIIHLGAIADFTTASGKSNFAKAVIESIGLNVAAILAMVWLESLIWFLEDRTSA